MVNKTSRLTIYPGGILNSKIILQIAVLVLISINAANSAKILFYVGIASHSHRVAIQPLATALSEKGHEITFFSPIKPEVKNPKIKDFCPEALSKYNDEILSSHGDNPVVTRMQDRYSDPFVNNYGSFIWEMSQVSNEITARSPDFQDWLKSSKFDLVVMEQPRMEFALGIAHHYGAKVIAFSPCPLWPHESDLFGIPTESSWFTSWTLKSPYSFIPDRFYQEFVTLGWYFTYVGSYLPRANSLLQEAFGNDIPTVQELLKNINLYMMNTHSSNDYGKSYPPFVVPVGGMHVLDPKLRKPLPKIIDDFIKESDEGFIYISFGSMAKISALPFETRKGFFDAIESFKNARFLIKWNDEIPEDMPKNLLPMKWFPQQDILAHPKIRGFVSQGGQMSSQQATNNGVPVVIVPVFGDQPYIAQAAEHHGYGIHLELADLTFDSFSHALSQLLYSETMSKNAKEVGRRFRDRPMSPVDTAVWWTEYVLRHNDTSHLKPLGLYQSWWQRRQLDFWAVVFIVILISKLLIVFLIRSLIQLYQKLQNKAQDKKKKQ